MATSQSWPGDLWSGSVAEVHVPVLLFGHQNQCPAQQIYSQPALECLQTPSDPAHSHIHVFSILWYTSAQGWGVNLSQGISPTDPASQSTAASKAASHCSLCRFAPIHLLWKYPRYRRGTSGKVRPHISGWYLGVWQFLMCLESHQIRLVQHKHTPLFKDESVKTGPETKKLLRKQQGTRGERKKKKKKLVGKKKILQIQSGQQ